MAENPNSRTFVLNLGNVPVNVQTRLQGNIGHLIRDILPDHASHANQPSVEPNAAPAEAIPDQASFILDIGEDGHMQQEPAAPQLDTNQNNNTAPNRTETPSQAQQLFAPARSALKWMDQSLPFVLLVLAKVFYSHRLGILVFVGLLGTFFHANTTLKRQIALREQRRRGDSFACLLWVILFLLSNVLFIYYVFEDQKLYRSLYLILPDIDEDKIDLWTLLWIVGISDFVAKFIGMMVKALFALVPKNLLAHKRKGKFYFFVEELSQFYRSVLPIVPWIYFLKDDNHGGDWFTAMLLILYMLSKVMVLWTKGRTLVKSFYMIRSDVSYGSVPNQAQMKELDGSCAICQDEFSDPVMLSCKHIFCEECVAMWFDRERTCPMCRANIIDNPIWRDGATSAHIQLY